MLAEQHIKRFPTTENNVGKGKSKSTGTVVVKRGFQTLLLLRTNKWLNVACVGNGFIECENLSFERSLRMKGTVLSGTAAVVHLTEKKNFFYIDYTQLQSQYS